MQKLGDLLENVLNEIENRIKEDINSNVLADNAGISSVHLQRLFKFAFDQPLGSYIRSRKLTASLESLLNTGYKVVNIAHEYGFEYEQSFLRSFKREFGITPSIIRKTNHAVKVTPPLNLLGSKIFENCIIFKPEKVEIPQFHVIGKKHQMLYCDIDFIAPHIGKHFWRYERAKIINSSKSDVFIGLMGNVRIDADYTWFLPSIQVNTLKKIPEGFEGYTVESSLYVNFRYIGQSRFYQELITDIYTAIENYFSAEFGFKFSLNIDFFFFKIYGLPPHDESFCQVECFIPVHEIINDEKC
jgi:AraC family transcriptional regulator